MEGKTNQTIGIDQIIFHAKSQFVEFLFQDGYKASLTCEFLRVFSPSAEVRGHAHDQEVLQVGKKKISIDKLEQIGNYAIKITFTDGHNTGLYSWGYIRDLGENKDRLWEKYLERLRKSGEKR